MSQNLVGKIELYKQPEAKGPGCLEKGLTTLGTIIFIALILYWGMSNGFHP